MTTCPFYGYNGMFDGLLATGGNQCALVLNAHSPCKMEMRGQLPDAEQCSFIEDIRRQNVLLNRHLPVVQSTPAKETP